MFLSGQEERDQLVLRVGSWRDTEIGDYTKIDNLVQVNLSSFQVNCTWKIPNCLVTLC